VAAKGRQDAAWARDDEYRWMAERRAAYARFLVAANRLQVPGSLMLDGKQVSSTFDAEAEVAALVLAHTELDLVASEDVRDPASQLLSAVLAVMKGAAAKLAGLQPVGIHPQELPERRRAFVDAARRDLGILPPSPMPRTTPSR